MSRPYLLVGESPNQATVLRPDLWLLPDRTGIPHSANRLLRLSGLTFQEYVDLFDRTNVWHEPEWPGMDEVRESVRARGRTFSGRRIVALGTRATKCLTGEHTTLFRWGIWQGWNGYFELARVPHPSAANRLLNDAVVRGEMRRFFLGIKASSTRIPERTDRDPASRRSPPAS